MLILCKYFTQNENADYAVKMRMTILQNHKENVSEKYCKLMVQLRNEMENDTKIRDLVKLFCSFFVVAILILFTSYLCIFSLVIEKNLKTKNLYPIITRSIGIFCCATWQSNTKALKKLKKSIHYWSIY